MFFAATLVSAIALFAASAQATETQTSDFVVHTPATVASCKPVNLTWAATKAPYNLIIVHSSDPCGPIIADLGDHTTNHYLWYAEVPAGNYSLSIEDAKGDEGWSARFEVKTNTLNTTCKFSTAYNNGSTVVVPADAAGATPSNDTSPGAVGAVGGGGLVGAAPSMRQLSAPAMAAAALIGAIAFSL
jgi:hypothetical protein